MADHITFTITGLKEAAIAVGRWTEDVHRQARDVLTEQIFFGVQDIQRVTPYGKTGNLLKGITSRVDPLGVSATITNRAEHAHLVEWGHRIVTHKGQDTGKRVKRHDPSTIVVPAMRRRELFYQKLKAILGRPIPGLDVTPEVRST